MRWQRCAGSCKHTAGRYALKDSWKSGGLSISRWDRSDEPIRNNWARRAQQPGTKQNDAVPERERNRAAQITLPRNYLTGGQGVPDAEAPEVAPLLPVDGVVLEFVDPEFAGPEFAELEFADPEFGDPALAEPGVVDPEPADPEFVVPEFVDPELVAPALLALELFEAFVELLFGELLLALLDVDPVLGAEVPAVPGIEPQGDVCADDPGVLLGFIVDGCVAFPGVGEFVDVEPGTGAGAVGVAVPPCGVVVPEVFAPALPEVPAGAAPPAGALCATSQTAQPRNIESKVSFVADIPVPPNCFLT